MVHKTNTRVHPPVDRLTASPSVSAASFTGGRCVFVTGYDAEVFVAPSASPRSRWALLPVQMTGQSNSRRHPSLTWRSVRAGAHFSDIPRVSVFGVWFAPRTSRCCDAILGEVRGSAEKITRSDAPCASLIACLPSPSACSTSHITMCRGGGRVLMSGPHPGPAKGKAEISDVMASLYSGLLRMLRRTCSRQAGSNHYVIHA